MTRVLWRADKAVAYRRKPLPPTPALAVCGTASNYVRRGCTSTGKADAPRPSLPVMAGAPSVEYSK